MLGYGGDYWLFDHDGERGVKACFDFSFFFVGSQIFDQSSGFVQRLFRDGRSCVSGGSGFSFIPSWGIRLMVFRCFHFNLVGLMASTYQRGPWDSTVGYSRDPVYFDTFLDRGSLVFLLAKERE